jgi:hypothetical protein
LGSHFSKLFNGWQFRAKGFTTKLLTLENQVGKAATQAQNCQVASGEKKYSGYGKQDACYN